MHQSLYTSIRRGLHSPISSQSGVLRPIDRRSIYARFKDARKTHSEQSTCFRGQMRTQTRPWKQHFTSAFYNIATALGGIFHISFITYPISQLHVCAQILPYCLGAFIVVLTRTTMFKYNVARRVSKPNMSAKFQGLVLFSLNSKKKMKMKTYRRIFNPFPMHVFA